MASRRFKNPFYALLFLLSESPLTVLKIVQYGLIFCFLFLVLAGSGGFIPFGEGLIGPGWVLLLLAGVHALTVVFRKIRMGVRWELLLPIPFLAYAWFQFRYLSPQPWEAAKLLTVLVQAYAFFIILFNIITGVRSMRWIVSLVQAVIWIGLIVALVQYHLFPDWFPGGAGRLRDPAMSHGMGGFLMDGQSMGALLLATLPLSLMLMVKHFRSGPNAILQGGMSAVAAVGILLSVHRPGLLLLLLVLVLVVLCISPMRRVRWKIIKTGLPALLLVLLAMWFGTGELRDRFMLYLDGPVAPLAAESRAVAWESFLEAPLTGHGVASFAALWERLLPTGIAADVPYPYSLYHGLLAESGLIGLALFFLPVVIFFGMSLLAWREIPYLKIDRDTARRLERLPSRHPARRRMEKEKGRLPTQKAYLAGTLIGLFVLLVYLLWDYSYMLPIVLLVAVSLAAIQLSLARNFRFEPASSLVGLITGLLPLLLVSWSFSFGIDRLASGHQNYLAQEKLDLLQADPDRIFFDPGSLSVVQVNLENALRLDPLNGSAWTNLAAAHMAHLHANLDPVREVAERARLAAVKAMELNPSDWRSPFLLARAQLILGEDSETALSLLEKSKSMAPRRAEPAGLLGSLLLLNDPRSQRGQNLVQQALDLAPDYGPVVNARRRQIAADRVGPQPGSPIIRPGLLAEQFYLIPQRTPVVRCAGLPDLADFLPQIPAPVADPQG